jgi:hypothetical protein
MQHEIKRVRSRRMAVVSGLALSFLVAVIPARKWINVGRAARTTFRIEGFRGGFRDGLEEQQ